MIPRRVLRLAVAVSFIPSRVFWPIVAVAFICGAATALVVYGGLR